MKSKREEWSGGGFYTKHSLKIKSTEVYVLVLYSHTNKAIKHIQGMPDMNNFISLQLTSGFFSSEFAFAVTSSLVRFPSWHSCAKYRKAWKLKFRDNLL